MRGIKVWAASRLMDAAAIYAARGRAYGGLSDARLAEKWAAAFRATVRRPSRADLRQLERDLSSEHKLRGRKVPHETVAKHRELLIAQIIATYERAPDAFEDADAGSMTADCELTTRRPN